MTLGEGIKKLRTLKIKKDKLNKKLKEVDREVKETEFHMMCEMENNGTKKASCAEGTISITESVMPRVEDWDAFYQYIRRNNFFYMLERRPAAVAFREKLEQRNNKDIPGVVPFTIQKLSLRKA